MNKLNWIQDINSEIQYEPQKKLKYFLTFMSIGQCGVGFLQHNIIYVIMFILLLFLYVIQKKRGFVKIVPWVWGVLLVFMIQVLLYQSMKVGFNQYSFLVLKQVTPFLYLLVIGKNYFKFYIRIIYVYCLLSLAFWLISTIFPQFYELIRYLASIFSKVTGSYVVEYKNLSFFLLFTYTGYSRFSPISGVPRNSGPFWEPGAFAVYIVVAIVFYYLLYNKFKSKYITVFCITLITTQSSAGYASLFILLMYIVALSRSKFKLLYTIALLVLLIFSFMKLPFLNEKVGGMYENQSNMDIAGSQESGRFYSTRRSLNAISAFPLFGRGMSRRTAADQYSEYYGSYGIVDMPARYGLILGIVYIIALIKSLNIYANKLNRKNSLEVVLMSLVILFPVYYSQGVYQSVVNLLIMQTAFRYRNQVIL